MFIDFLWHDTDYQTRDCFPPGRLQEKRRIRVRVLDANGKLIPFVVSCNTVTGEVFRQRVYRFRGIILYASDMELNWEPYVRETHPAPLTYQVLEEGCRVRDPDNPEKWITAGRQEYFRSQEDFDAIPEWIPPPEESCKPTVAFSDTVK